MNSSWVLNRVSFVISVHLVLISLQAIAPNLTCTVIRLRIWLLMLTPPELNLNDILSISLILSVSLILKTVFYRYYNSSAQHQYYSLHWSQLCSRVTHVWHASPWIVFCWLVWRGTRSRPRVAPRPPSETSLDQHLQCNWFIQRLVIINQCWRRRLPMRILWFIVRI